MKKLLVSACLLGCECRYDGNACPGARVLALKDVCQLIPVCPEQLGGLPTPRAPAERKNGGVYTETGENVTAAFEAGAAAALRLAKTLGAEAAVLKAHSPSCGKGAIYDGSFTGRRITGDGVTAALLLANGVPVYTEDEVEMLLSKL